jgi:hypothetical protein
VYDGDDNSLNGQYWRQLNAPSIIDVEMELQSEEVRPSASSLGSSQLAARSQKDKILTAQESMHYIVVDTNILIHSLQLVQQLHHVLQDHIDRASILIPSVVINELDSLGMSEKLSDQGTRTVGELAKAATRWLLDANRDRRRAGKGVVRCQRWVERLDKEVSVRSGTHIRISTRPSLYTMSLSMSQHQQQSFLLFHHTYTRSCRNPTTEYSTAASTSSAILM